MDRTDGSRRSDLPALAGAFRDLHGNVPALTPKQTQMKRKRPAKPVDIFAPLDDAEFDELDRFLVSDATSDETLTLPGLDGYLTALVIGPTTVMPSRWLPGVWGGEELSPFWESMADFEHIYGMLLRHMNS